MKTKIILLFVCLATFSSIGFGQKKKPVMSAPEKLVQSLYAAQKSDKTSPFYQTKSRALVDKYFSADLGELLWKDAVIADGELNAMDFDPLFYSQDPQVTKFVIGKPKPAVSPDFSTIPVTFLDNNTKVTIEFEVMRQKGSIWKIDNIYYSDGEDLQSILRYGVDPEFKKEFDENQTFRGDYMVGNVKCSVTPTFNGFKQRVECENEKGFKLYFVEGSEEETTYIYVDEKEIEKGKFVFKTGEKDGVYIDASGKSTKVTAVPQDKP